MSARKDLLLAVSAWLSRHRRRWRRRRLRVVPGGAQRHPAASGAHASQPARDHDRLRAVARAGRVSSARES
jgi:hypothetical protein